MRVREAEAQAKLEEEKNPKKCKQAIIHDECRERVEDEAIPEC